MLANEALKDMTLPEIGLLYLMRLTCWVSGRVPADPERLAKRVSHLVEHVQLCLTPNVLSFFESIPDQQGFLHAPELTNYKKLLADKREERSNSGKRGANSRWKTKGSRNGSANGIANGSLSTNQLSKREGALPPDGEDDIPF
jgi:hypothetical protein